MLNLFGYVRTDPRSVHVFSGEPRPYFTPGGLDLLNTNPALWLDDLSCQFDKLSAWGLWKKKQSSFASCDWALLFLFAKFFQNKGLTTETFLLPWPSEICWTECQSQNYAQVSRNMTSFVSTFLPRKKYPSQSALAHELMCSGFFICPSVRKAPQGIVWSNQIHAKTIKKLPLLKWFFPVQEKNFQTLLILPVVVISIEPIMVNSSSR